jgi:hypothetical protein
MRRRECVGRDAMVAGPGLDCRALQTPKDWRANGGVELGNMDLGRFLATLTVAIGMVACGVPEPPAAGDTDHWRSGIVREVLTERSNVPDVNDECVRQAPNRVGDTVLVVAYRIGRTPYAKAFIPVDRRRWQVGDRVRIEPYRCSVLFVGPPAA